MDLSLSPADYFTMPAYNLGRANLVQSRQFILRRDTIAESLLRPIDHNMKMSANLRQKGLQYAFKTYRFYLKQK